MKLTKNKLIKQTKDGLQKLGYSEFSDTITPAQGLYVKALENNFYLTLGLTISRYYDSLFTASFYLSKATTWATFGGDIPDISYRRLGHFLTKEERKILLKGEYALQDSGDAWWNIENETGLVGFLEAIRITEPRFLGQPELYDKVSNSTLVNELWSLSKKAIEMINSNDNINEYNYQFIPQKTIDNIPIEYFKVAERVIKSENAILNVNTVKRLAGDVYRQKKIFSAQTNTTGPN